MKRVATATVLFSAVALVANAQSTVRGRVIADDTGDPIPHARVAVASNAPGTPVSVADGDRSFVLAVPANAAAIVASKTGYARLEMPLAGARQPFELRLRKGGVVSGRVVDEFGEPVAGARITVERASAALRAERTPASAGPPPPGATGARVAAAATADSDDRGDYRVAGLPDGRYVVAATTIGPAMSVRVNGNEQLYGPTIVKTYYPDASAP